MKKLTSDKWIFIIYIIICIIGSIWFINVSKKEDKVYTKKELACSKFYDTYEKSFGAYNYWYSAENDSCNIRYNIVDIMALENK